MATSFWPTSLVEYAEIVSAIGTAAAVIISLHLASRKPKPLLQVTADTCVIIGVGEGRPSFLRIRVVNIGAVDALLTGLSWKVRRRWPWQKDAWGYQDVTSTTRYHANPKLPVRLAHGEEALFLLETHGAYNWFAQIEEKGIFPDRLKSRRDVDRLRIVAGTSITYSEGEVNGKLRNEIWEANCRHFEQATGLADDR